MDFKAPPPVIDALARHVEQGVFGYTLPPEDLLATVLERLDQVHRWKVAPEWIVWLPGLVTGLNVTCRAVGNPGDAVMTSTPVYPPFLSAPSLSGRELVTVPHAVENGRYVFDFEAIEKTITPKTKLFLLCNPQNPAGRVFTAGELQTLATICLSRGIVICSDEIHCDLVLDEDKHHLSLAALNDEVAAQTITLLAPSKTYNLPGLGCALAVIPDRELRSSFKKAMAGIVPHVNALGLTAALAAYRHSEDWRQSLLDYLRGNRNLVEDFVARSPGIGMHHVEATYLAWIDCRELPTDRPAAFFEEAGIGLSDGAYFGTEGFVRLNFGCPRSLLLAAMERMEKALHSLLMP